jgi:hypothetical protein
MVDAGEVTTTFKTEAVDYTATGSDVNFITFTNLQDKVILHIDTTNMADPTTIKVKGTINGTIDLILSTKIFPTDYDSGVTGIVYILNGAGEDMKVTLNSTTAVLTTIGTNSRTEIRL